MDPRIIHVTLIILTMFSIFFMVVYTIGNENKIQRRVAVSIFLILITVTSLKIYFDCQNGTVKYKGLKSENICKCNKGEN